MKAVIRYAKKFVLFFGEYTGNYRKKRDDPLFFSVSLLITVAAGAVLAVAGVSDMNAIQFAVHSVLIEFTIGNPAGNAAINLFRHFRSSLPVFWANLMKNIPIRLTKHARSYKMRKRRLP